MLRRSTLTLLVLALAVSAGASNYPHPAVGAVQVKVGETVQVRVDLVHRWGGYEFRPVFFESSNPRFVEVRGRMPVAVPAYMSITGVRPGRAEALLLGSDSTRYGAVDVTIVCGREPAIQTAEAQQTVKIGEPVLLRALSPIAERTTFTWYRGLVGDMSAPIAESGPEIAFTTNGPGQHHAWVMAITPCSSSTAQFQIDAVAPRRRATRH